ncbi:MAG: glyoxalase, partial [Pseudolabrys sp.]
MESGTVIAILPCNDLDASERFYARLGFVRIERPAEECKTYRMLSNGKGRLHLTTAVEGWLVPGRNPFGLYFYMEDVDIWA